MAPKRNILIALFRNDLRVHDNPILSAATRNQAVTHLLPLYIFDQRIFDLSGLHEFQAGNVIPAPKTPVLRLPKTGQHRTRFIVEAVFDLRDNLRSLNSDLHIAYGIPEQIMERIVRQFRAKGDTVDSVWMSHEYTSEELSVENGISKTLTRVGISVHDPTRLQLVHTKTLIHPSDLPFSPLQCPDVFTHFRKAVEGLSNMVRPCEEQAHSNEQKPFPADVYDTDQIEQAGRYQKSPHNETLQNSLDRLLKPFPTSNSSVNNEAHTEFKGGETSALARLSHYTSPTSTAPIATYKQTRNGLLGADYSTKLSPWLACGCISPRKIVEAIDIWDERWTEGGNGSKDSYWVRFELLWRDYFVFIGVKYGNQLFKLEGIHGALGRSGKRQQTATRKDDPRKVNNPRDKVTGSSVYSADARWKDVQQEPWKGFLERWKEGRTGVPFIDANMIELRETGFMSNRGRQNVASYLAKDLGLDWRAGAEVFEERLLDYDPTSNYGNWMYAAGVGTDPRDGRQFNPIKQGKDYDPEGGYIKTWLPNLIPVPALFIHHPWTAPSSSSFLSIGHVPEEYTTSPPMGEQHGWKSQYSRRIGQGSKTNGNEAERVEWKGGFRQRGNGRGRGKGQGGRR